MRAKGGGRGQRAMPATRGQCCSAGQEGRRLTSSLPTFRFLVFSFLFLSAFFVFSMCCFLMCIASSMCCSRGAVAKRCALNVLRLLSLLSFVLLPLVATTNGHALCFCHVDASPSLFLFFFLFLRIAGIQTAPPKCCLAAKAQCGRSRERAPPRPSDGAGLLCYRGGRVALVGAARAGSSGTALQFRQRHVCVWPPPSTALCFLLASVMPCSRACANFVASLSLACPSCRTPVLVLSPCSACHVTPLFMRARHVPTSST